MRDTNIDTNIFRGCNRTPANSDEQLSSQRANLFNQFGNGFECRRTRADGLLVPLSREVSNQIFAELADWEQVLKDTSLAGPKPPAP